MCSWISDCCNSISNCWASCWNSCCTTPVNDASGAGRDAVQNDASAQSSSHSVPNSGSYTTAASAAARSLDLVVSDVDAAAHAALDVTHHDRNQPPPSTSLTATATVFTGSAANYLVANSHNHPSATSLTAAHSMNQISGHLASTITTSHPSANPPTMPAANDIRAPVQRNQFTALPIISPPTVSRTLSAATVHKPGTVSTSTTPRGRRPSTAGQTQKRHRRVESGVLAEMLNIGKGMLTTTNAISISSGICENDRGVAFFESERKNNPVLAQAVVLFGDRRLFNDNPSEFHVLVDSSNRIVVATANAMRMLERSSTSVLGQNVTTFFAIKDRNDLISKTSDVFAKKSSKRSTPSYLLPDLSIDKTGPLHSLLLPLPLIAIINEYVLLRFEFRTQVAFDLFSPAIVSTTSTEITNNRYCRMRVLNFPYVGSSDGPVSGSVSAPHTPRISPIRAQSSAKDDHVHSQHSVTTSTQPNAPRPRTPDAPNSHVLEQRHSPNTSPLRQSIAPPNVITTSTAAAVVHSTVFNFSTAAATNAAMNAAMHAAAINHSLQPMQNFSLPPPAIVVDMTRGHERVLSNTKNQLTEGSPTGIQSPLSHETTSGDSADDGNPPLPSHLDIHVVPASPTHTHSSILSSISPPVISANSPPVISESDVFSAQLPKRKHWNLGLPNTNPTAAANTSSVSSASVIHPAIPTHPAPTSPPLTSPVDWSGAYGSSTQPPVSDA